jgi:hypothetical protein
MRPSTIVFPTLLLGCAVLIAQANVSNAPVKIYALESDVTSPQLLPPSSPHSYTSEGCRSDDDGTATFSLIVDAGGQPRNIYFLNPIGDDLDLIALREVITDRFNPGKSAGQPVAVAASLQVKLHACLAERKDAHGKSQNVLELTSAPEQQLEPPVDPPQQAALVSGSGLSTNSSDPDAGIQKLGGDVTAPVRFRAAPATMRQAYTLLGNGQYKVSVVVDRYGLPERMRIVEAERPGREQEIAAVFRLLRFKPAMKLGVPVPVRIEVSLEQASGISASGRR